MTTVNLHQTVTVGGCIQITAYYAGHVLGAAMFLVRVGLCGFCLSVCVCVCVIALFHFHCLASDCGLSLSALACRPRCAGDQSVVYTGDYNMTPDRHLSCAWMDATCPDLLITETTYRVLAAFSGASLAVVFFFLASPLSRLFLFCVFVICFACCSDMQR